MSDAAEECECPAGIPAWMATFADLMSLLMCFFVLLLSFSEMDVLKYKQLAGSMRNAFGVQNVINVKDIPKGTSIVAQEFSPARPEPTPINEVRQSTTDAALNTLDIRVKEKGVEDPSDPTEVQKPGEAEQPPEKVADEELANEELAKQLLVEKVKALVKATQKDAKSLAYTLKKEISAGKVEIETRGRRIIIRVREQGSFPSGSAQLQQQFLPVMTRVRAVLAGIKGKIAIEGHTDSIPIATATFRSNWDLASARALSVAHELFKGKEVDHNRFLVTGYADTRPLVANDTADNRKRNRRVEIVVHQGIDDETSEDLKALQKTNPGLVQDLDLDTPFGLTPDEIF